MEKYWVFCLLKKKVENCMHNNVLFFLWKKVCLGKKDTEVIY